MARSNKVLHLESDIAYASAKTLTAAKAKEDALDMVEPIGWLRVIHSGSDKLVYAANDFLKEMPDKLSQARTSIRKFQTDMEKARAELPKSNSKDMKFIWE